MPAAHSSCHPRRTGQLVVGWRDLKNRAARRRGREDLDVAVEERDGREADDEGRDADDNNRNDFADLLFNEASMYRITPSLIKRGCMLQLLAVI